MTNKFLLNRSGMSPEVTCRKGRHAIESIVSRFSLASLICLCMLTVGSGNAWGASVTLTLSDNSTDTWTNQGKSGGGTAIAMCDKTVTGISLSGTSGYCRTSDNYTQIYSGSTITITSTAGNMTSVAITCKGSNNNDYSPSKFTLKSGSTGSYSNGGSGSKVGTWTGNATTFTLTAGAQVRVTQIVVTYTAAATPTVTPDPTSLDWGTVLQGSSQGTKTISITGSNLTAGTLTISATGGYSVTPTSKSVSGTLAATTLTVTPPSTSTTGAKNGKVTISGGGLASAVEVNLSMTVNAASTVTWMNNGSEYTTTLVENGSKPEFPDNPSSCDGTSTTFVGWTPTPWSGKLDDVSDKTIYTSGTAMPNVSGPVTYHAVFAKSTASGDYIKGTKADLTEGQTVLIVNNNSSYALSSELDDDGYCLATSVSISSSKISSPASALIWTVEIGPNDGYYFKHGTKYINAYYDSSEGTHHLYYDAYTDEWTLTGSGPYVLNSTEDSGYKLYYWSTYSCFDTYTGTGNPYNTDFYIPEITYSQYLTTCASCDANPTIGAASLNGTFSLSSVGVRCPTSGTAVQDNCEWEDYGFVWGTNNTGTRPDLTSDASNKVQTGTSGTGNTWDDDLESTFTTGITYYYRAYGENGHGLAYGDVASFTPYKVYYNANGGTGSIDDQIVNTGGSVTLSDGTGFSKDGYHITQWALGSASGTQSDLSSSSGSVTANKEYYAIWTANTYTVTFDKNGGSGDAMSGQAFTYGTAQNLSANTYTAPDHMYFLGWNTDKDATTALYGNNESVNNLTTTNNGTVTLYAIWKEHTYTAYRTNCCTKPTFTISGTGKSETIDGKISFPVLREDLSGVPSSTWAELEITISSNSSGAITIIEGTGVDAGKTAWKLSSWESRNTDGGTIATTDHATFTNPSAGNYLFKVKTTASGGYTGQGTYRIGIQQAANGDYCAATVYLWVDVTLRDKFVDNVNGNGTVNRDGHGAQLATPTLSEFGTQVEDACHEEGRKLKGWIKETDLKAQYETGNSTRVQTIDGLCESCSSASDQTSLIVTPGTNVTMSGATWYAVWAYEK